MHNHEEDSQKLQENMSEEERYTLLTKSSDNSGLSNSMSSNLTIAYHEDDFSEKDVDATRLLITTLESTEENSFQIHPL